MEVELAQEFRRLVGLVLHKDEDRDHLYGWLQDYHVNQLSIESLAKHAKQLVNCPDRLPLFENLRMVIADEDQVKFNENIPRHRPLSIHKTTLNIGNEGQLGFSIRGGIEYGIGIYVVCVEASSLADRNGIEKGDEILQVNKYPIHQCTHKEAVNLITANKKRLSLKVRHVGMVPQMKDVNSLLWKFADELEEDGKKSMKKPKKKDTCNNKKIEDLPEPENKQIDSRNELLQYQKEAIEREKRRATRRTASSKSVDVKSSKPITASKYKRATSDVFPMSQKKLDGLKREKTSKQYQNVETNKTRKPAKQKPTVGPIQEYVEAKVKEEDLKEDGVEEQSNLDKSQAGKKLRKQSELEKRLIQERLARLNQEKALKLSRLRQEAKEAEREEHRLKYLLTGDDDEMYTSKEIELSKNKKFFFTAPTELKHGEFSSSCQTNISPTENNTHVFCDGGTNRHGHYICC